MFQYPSQQLTLLLFPSLFLSLAISPGVRCSRESPPVRYCTGNKSNKTEIDTKNMFIGRNLSGKVFPRISHWRIYAILSYPLLPKLLSFFYKSPLSVSTCVCVCVCVCASLTLFLHLTLSSSIFFSHYPLLFLRLSYSPASFIFLLLLAWFPATDSLWSRVQSSWRRSWQLPAACHGTQSNAWICRKNVCR